MKTLARLVFVGALVIVAVTLVAKQLSSLRRSSHESLAGTWSLESRNEITSDGIVRVDPGLGETPLGLLYYDNRGHMAVQLMRRDRANGAGSPPVRTVGPTNNTDTSSGYDAYFGSYTVDRTAGTVTHHVEGALSPADVGKNLVRNFELSGARLVLRVKTTGSDGKEVTRTLVWRRAA